MATAMPGIELGPRYPSRPVPYKTQKTAALIVTPLIATCEAARLLHGRRSNFFCLITRWPGDRTLAQHNRPLHLVRSAVTATSLAALLGSTALPAAAEGVAPPSCIALNRLATMTNVVKADVPPLAQAAHMTGVATLRVDLDANGALTSVQVVRSSGYRVLDDAALRTAHQIAYSAEVRDCRPRSGSYALEVDFDD